MWLYGFVILNYKNAINTVKCVDSIRKSAIGNELYIIVVDNGSKDDSLDVLEKKYANDSDIEIIANDENLGFSKGMNIGFEYAKSILNCDFIFLVNNDTLMLTSNFLNIVMEDYKQYQFAVLGPKIISPPKVQSNPYVQIEKTPREMLQLLNKRYIKFRIREISFSLGIGVIRRNAQNLLESYKNKNGLKRKNLDSPHVGEGDHVRLNSGLHGSFLVFSPIYVQEYDGIEDVTFAYGEEWLIYNRCNERGWLMIYEPRILVEHEGDSVSKKSTTSLRTQILRRTKLEIESNKKLRQYIINKYVRV